MDSLTEAARVRWSVEESYEYCRNLARSHYENFTVGSWFLPREKRPHVYAVYAFCRFVDDLGDESQGDRLGLLDSWEEELRSCYASRPNHPITVALAETIQRFHIPQEPFLKLIESNRMDQRAHRHRTYEDLLRYCDHSANPVGRLFLYLFGYRDEERQRLADATCTALQLTNFWQDVRRDMNMGRVYIPQEDMERFGYTEERLQAGVADESFRDLMRFQVDRARDLFDRGAGLASGLTPAGRAQWKGQLEAARRRPGPWFPESKKSESPTYRGARFTTIDMLRACPVLDTGTSGSNHVVPAQAGTQRGRGLPRARDGFLLGGRNDGGLLPPAHALFFPFVVSLSNHMSGGWTCCRGRVCLGGRGRGPGRPPEGRGSVAGRCLSWG